jgi:two-component system, OmpR family, phosphate regulon sensor histidine kinase PhoR
MFKDFTPRQIASWIAIVATLCFGLIFWILQKMNGFAVNSFLMFNIYILFGFFIYFVAFTFIDNFIYQKVKLIYKTIYNNKAKPNENPRRENVSEDVFDSIENQVMRWVVESERKISDLTALEEYRRNFVGNVSHELKTPIFNIQGFLETIIDDNLENKALAEKYLQRALKNVERLQIIVDDLLAIERLDAGKESLLMEDFNIKTLIEDIIEDTQHSAKEKQITVGLKENVNTNAWVKADIESISKVLINLIQNAIKYGKPNGTVRIGIYDMAERILIEVSDDGIGIDNEHLPFLFDRFYRADKSRSRNEGGSGLGLSIVKHIIEAHLQTIHVRSTVGVGTTLAFTLAKS